MKTAGLTGGIATGKSTVAGFFRERGAEVVCADEAARDVVLRGKPAWTEIVAAFGREILGPDGELDREKMGRQVFSDPESRRRLEAIVHPRVFRWMDERIGEIRERNPAAVVIQDVPLLFESGMAARLRPVLVVYAPESVQLKRLMERDGRSEADARARIDAQMSIEEKRRRADRVIDNGGSPEETRRQVADIFEWLRDRDESRSEGSST
ncbi:MAG: dephospho-CoA kinase [Desulfococcaceae bacterium]